MWGVNSGAVADPHHLLPPHKEQPRSAPSACVAALPAADHGGPLEPWPFHVGSRLGPGSQRPASASVVWFTLRSPTSVQVLLEVGVGRAPGPRESRPASRGRGWQAGLEHRPGSAQGGGCVLSVCPLFAARVEGRG